MHPLEPKTHLGNMSAKSCLVIGATAIPVMMFRTPNPFSSLSFPRLTTKTLFSQPTHFRRYSLTATAETVHGGPASATQGLDNHHHHPWPEWVAFVDHLKSQGYFSQASSDNVGDATHLLYREMNVLKDPCLSFARDRYDIFSSLPKDDIQIIVEGGCPKLLRKVVNSAKRLRLYVGLNEQKVCSVCSLQGSCDRAYVMLKESDGDGRTVDLMRLLMFYALDPSLVSGAGRTAAIEQAESSSRRLLSMFIDLSKASPGLACVESPETTSNKKKQFANSMDVMLPPKIHSQQEKWISNNENNSRKAGPADVEVKQGDWICPECRFMNFKRNVRCLKCRAEAHKQGSAHDVKMKKGDWNCPHYCQICGEIGKLSTFECGYISSYEDVLSSTLCGCINFARRKECFRCNYHRPPRTLQPGEWECPKCDFLNFRRNIACFKCGTERMKESVTQYEEQFWRKPQ